MLQTILENRDLLLTLGFLTALFGFAFPTTFGNGNAEFYAQLEQQGK
ncbi:hypothetical protein [Caballeronia sp. Lep1P3]|jgi:hypothetical protein|nr:hypothetical protein [Caballeronia sp. Lep1P3]